MTRLLNGARKTLLAERVRKGIEEGSDNLPDVLDRVFATGGQAFHSALENVWNHDNHIKPMIALGYSKKAISSLRINPTDGVHTPLDIHYELEGGRYTLPCGEDLVGTPDIIMGGTVIDLKNKFDHFYPHLMAEMGTLNKLVAVNAPVEEIESKCPKAFPLVMQGSGYRVLHQEIITKDIMKIIFRIRDWKTSSKTPHAIQAVALPLIPVDKTIEYLDKIVRSIRKHTDVPESRLPQCTHRVRGIDAPVYKYFSKPTNKRATNVFLSREDAVRHMQTVTKGNLRTVYGDPKNCKYCAGKSLCNT